MIDVEKQAAYWNAGAIDDFEAATALLDKGKVRQAMFFARLVIEKALKAHVCRATGDLAPRIHDLLRLAELGDVTLDDDRRAVLVEANSFNLAGRYPDTWPLVPSETEASALMVRVDEVVQWLISPS